MFQPVCVYYIAVVMNLKDIDSLSLTTTGSTPLIATLRARSSQVSIYPPFCHHKRGFLGYAKVVVAYIFGLRDAVFPIHLLGWQRNRDTALFASYYLDA
jgi:hypothetical protein